MSLAQTPGSTEKAKLQKILLANPDNTAARQELARLFFEESNWNEVIKTLKPYADRLTTQGSFLLASAQHEMKLYEDEVLTLKQLTANQPDNFRAWTLLGTSYFTNKKYDESVKAYRTALSLNKKHRPAYEGLIDVFIQTKADYELREVLKDQIKAFGKDSRSYSQLCKSYYHGGYVEQASEACIEARRLNPKSPDNYIVLGLSLIAKQMVAEGERVLLEASQKFPKSEFAQWAMGDLHLKKNNTAAAYRYFSAAVKADPNSSRSNKGLGISAFAQEKYEEALKAFHTACLEDKSVGQDVRTAAATLRQKKIYDWHEKYQIETRRCR